MRNDEILGDFDYPYIASRLRRAREHRWIERFVNGINVEGLDNLRALRGNHFVCFSNHRSHFDYVGLGYVFLQNLRVEDFPRIIAGKNLDSRILAIAGLDFSRMGAFFVDREKIKILERQERADYLKSIERSVLSSLAARNNFFDFVEGGRNYFSPPLERFKTGFIEHFIEATSQQFLGIDPLVLTCAVDYDRVIEEDFFPALEFCKENFRVGYYVTDAFAFLFRPFLREGRGSMYVNFGEPKRLSQIISSDSIGTKVLQLRDYVREETARLYAGIRTSRRGLEPLTH